MEPSMESCLAQVLQKDVGRRLQVGQEIIDFIADRQKSQDLEQDQTMLDRMVDGIATTWVNSSNFKPQACGPDRTRPGQPGQAFTTGPIREGVSSPRPRPNHGVELPKEVVLPYWQRENQRCIPACFAAHPRHPWRSITGTIWQSEHKLLWTVLPDNKS